MWFGGRDGSTWLKTNKKREKNKKSPEKQQFCLLIGKLGEETIWGKEAKKGKWAALFLDILTWTWDAWSGTQ